MTDTPIADTDRTWRVLVAEGPRSRRVHADLILAPGSARAVRMMLELHPELGAADVDEGFCLEVYPLPPAKNTGA